MAQSSDGSAPFDLAIATLYQAPTAGIGTLNDGGGIVVGGSVLANTFSQTQEVRQFQQAPGQQGGTGGTPEPIERRLIRVDIKHDQALISKYAGYLRHGKNGYGTPLNDQARKAYREEILKAAERLAAAQARLAQDDQRAAEERHRFRVDLELARDARLGAEAKELERLHAQLDAAGAVPILGAAADGISFILYMEEGKPGEASISLAAMIPVAGDAAGNGGKLLLFVNKHGDEVVDSTKLLAKLAPSRVTFHGMEVRAVRDLSHLDVGTLRAMAKKGFAAKDINGERIVLHHLGQRATGPVVEMPAYRHSIHNKIQHPLGNKPRVGLTEQERAAFEQWRIEYWKTRAIEELKNRGVTP